MKTLEELKEMSDDLKIIANKIQLMITQESTQVEILKNDDMFLSITEDQKKQILFLDTLYNDSAITYKDYKTRLEIIVGEDNFRKSGWIDELLGVTFGEYLKLI